MRVKIVFGFDALRRFRRPCFAPTCFAHEKLNAFSRNQVKFRHPIQLLSTRLRQGPISAHEPFHPHNSNATKELEPQRQKPQPIQHQEARSPHRTHEEPETCLSDGSRTQSQQKLGESGSSKPNLSFVKPWFLGRIQLKKHIPHFYSILACQQRTARRGWKQLWSKPSCGLVLRKPSFRSSFRQSI